MSFSPDQGAYGSQGNWAPGMQAPGMQAPGMRPPGNRGRRGGTRSTYVTLTAPILLLTLGLAGFFLGFAPALGESGSSSSIGNSGETVSMFESVILMVFPMMVLISGLIGIAGLIPGERSQVWLSTAFSGVTAATMLCLLTSFDDSVSTAWAYWVVFTILLAQIGIALFAIFIGAGVITVRTQQPGMPGNWQGPGQFGPRQPQFPARGPQMQTPPPAQGPPPAQD